MVPAIASMKAAGKYAMVAPVSSKTGFEKEVSVSTVAAHTSSKSGETIAMDIKFTRYLGRQLSASWHGPHHAGGGGIYL